MLPRPTAPQVLDREFLTLRCRLLDLAAGLDRIERAEGSADADLRLEKLRRGLAILLGPAGNRAEQVQWVFSLKQDPNLA